jgi:hypothetical protein
MLWPVAELSWLSPFAANITDCYSHCCCAAAMAILHAIKSSCSLGQIIGCLKQTAEQIEKAQFDFFLNSSIIL